MFLSSLLFHELRTASSPLISFLKRAEVRWWLGSDPIKCTCKIVISHKSRDVPTWFHFGTSTPYSPCEKKSDSLGPHFLSSSTSSSPGLRWNLIANGSSLKLPSWIIATCCFKILTNHLGSSFSVDFHELPITQNHTGQSQTVKESSLSTMHVSVLNCVMTLLLHLLLYHQQMPGCPSNFVYG